MTKEYFGPVWELKSNEQFRNNYYFRSLNNEFSNMDIALIAPHNDNQSIAKSLIEITQYANINFSEEHEVPQSTITEPYMKNGPFSLFLPSISTEDNKLISQLNGNRKVRWHAKNNKLNITLVNPAQIHWNYQKNKQKVILINNKSLLLNLQSEIMDIECKYQKVHFLFNTYVDILKNNVNIFDIHNIFQSNNEEYKELEDEDFIYGIDEKIEELDNNIHCIIPQDMLKELDNQHLREYTSCNTRRKSAYNVKPVQEHFNKFYSVKQDFEKLLFKGKEENNFLL